MSDGYDGYNYERFKALLEGLEIEKVGEFLSKATAGDSRKLGQAYAEATKDKIDSLTRENAEKDKWRLALEGLTPQGSEFHNNLEHCVGWVSRAIGQGHEAKKDRVRLTRENESLREERDRYMYALTELRDDSLRGSAVWKAASQALAGKED